MHTETQHQLLWPYYLQIFMSKNCEFTYLSITNACSHYWWEKHIWKTYLENLYYDFRAQKEPKIEDRTDPDILLDEVKSAIKQLKEGKASGSDQIHSEFIRLLDDEKIKWIAVIFISVYESGIIHEDWIKSEFIALPKKSSAKTCEDYRTISLMNHLLKLFLNIIHKSI